MRTISKDVTKFAIKIEGSELINQITVTKTGYREYCQNLRACAVWHRLSTPQILMCLISVAVHLFLVLKNLITTVSFLSVCNENFPEKSVTY
jgi:hypothetical protein